MLNYNKFWALVKNISKPYLMSVDICINKYAYKCIYNSISKEMYSTVINL